jgi:hypothetical protein
LRRLTLVRAENLNPGVLVMQPANLKTWVTAGLNLS